MCSSSLWLSAQQTRRQRTTWTVGTRSVPGSLDILVHGFGKHSRSWRFSKLLGHCQGGSTVAVLRDPRPPLPSPPSPSQSPTKQEVQQGLRPALGKEEIAGHRRTRVRRAPQPPGLFLTWRLSPFCGSGPGLPRGPRGSRPL